MRPLLRTLAAVTLILVLPWAAARAEDDPELTLLLDNDHPRLSFWGTDRGYTSGLGIYYVRRRHSVPGLVEGLARALAIDATPASEAPPTASWGLGLGQLIYTPDDLRQPGPLPNDRPYAGWLYGSLFFNVRTRRSVQSFVAQLGIVGPGALAEATQKLIHRTFGYPEPEGWDHQLRSEPGLVLLYQQRTRLFEATTDAGHRWLDIAPTGTVALGNVATYATLGGRLRIGHNLGDTFGPPVLTPAVAYAPLEYAPTRPDGWELGVFLGYEARLVLRDLFLDGSTFTDSIRVRKKPVVLEFEAGISARISRFRLTWRYVQASAAFYGDSRFQYWGSFQFGYRFD